jgi:hypothetical protein
MPVLRYWDAGTSTWVDLGGNSSPEVYIGIDPPVSRAGQVLWVDTDDTAPGLIGQRWSPEFLSDSGANLAAGSQGVGATITHNLGYKGLIVGHLEDGSWAHQFAWRMSINTATQVQITFLNHGPNPGQALLRFRMLY